METIAFLVLLKYMHAVQSHPIENGFTIKFNPISSRELVKLVSVTSDYKKPVEEKQETLLFDLKPDTPNLSSKVKMEEKVKDGPNNEVLNMPVLTQDYRDYTLLVATAPKNFYTGSGQNDKKMVLYVVFPDDQTIDEIPRIYFVKQKNGKKKVSKEVRDPILIIDNNRTVTGLKSNEIAKFLQFRNKLTNHFKYNITPF